MKGIILAGGTGSRMYPLTKTTNKHLLPVYDKQMILFALGTLARAGINDILIVSGPGHAGQFLELLGSGYDFGLDIKYAIQEKALGIAHALWVGKKFAGDDDLAVILGDNILEDNIEKEVKSFKGGAKIFLKKVPDPNRFGVAEIRNGKIINLVEKPKDPKSDLAVIGLYMYSKEVWDLISEINYSERHELEITDLNNIFLKKDMIDYALIKGEWYDAGTIDGLYKATDFIMRQICEKNNELGLKIPEKNEN